ncbi:hypothetical protein PIB30_068512 [Stylosanthes scabra]|uniref:Major facilitator superfamily (MFS) profile domain-containing protein n=1 Tax=Stylosanthes scabra TaxID=79078 RepID=A0ABU6ZLN3_9FABA|nr:hypothetical protein [Stylosanthes scabra]
MAVELGDHGEIRKEYAYLLLVLICIYIAWFGWSWGPLGWLVPSEIFSLEIRSASQSVNVAVNFLFTFIVAQTFLSMLCYFKAGTFFFFGGWVVVMTAFVYFLLPETKNVPIEQMEKAGTLFFFGGWVVVMTAFVYFLLPETKNVPIEQMEKVWREHLFWKRIVGNKSSEGTKIVVVAP